MEFVNGEFYMLSCEEDDLLCLHTAEELAKLIRKFGFLPLLDRKSVV